MKRVGSAYLIRMNPHSSPSGAAKRKPRRDSGPANDLVANHSSAGGDGVCVLFRVTFDLWRSRKERPLR